MRIAILFVAAVAMGVPVAIAAKPGERLPIGEFTAARFEHSPAVDGKVAPGEWDRALTTSGLMAPFEHQLQESETTMSLGFNAERFYFLFRCRRGNREWKLWKHSRFNDDYHFAEIPQHPQVRLVDDGVVAQLTGVSTILTGRCAFEIGVVAPRSAAAEADVELRFHKAKTAGDDDRVERRRVKVAAGGRQTLALSGDVTDWTPADKNGLKAAYFTVAVTRLDGTLVFRQSFPYAISGWTPQTPVKPENAPPVEGLALSAQYGPQTNTVLVKADILDLPTRSQVAVADATVLGATTSKALGRATMRPFSQWYGGAELRLTGVEVPTEDFRQLAGPMRLVAVRDGQEIEFAAGAPQPARRSEAAASFRGAADAAGLRLQAHTRVEFDGFVQVELVVAPAAGAAAKVDKLFLEIALPAAQATHFCTTAGGWAAVHDALPDRWTSQSYASGMLVGDFAPVLIVRRAADEATFSGSFDEDVEAEKTTLKHPCLLGRPEDLARWRQKFNDPRFGAFRSALLAEAEGLMTYQGEAPQPGKDIGPSTRAYKLWAQKRRETLETLPWCYVLTGEARYRDLFLSMMRFEWRRKLDPQVFNFEFELTRTGAPAAIAYDLLWPELSAEDRRDFGAYLDQYFVWKTKPSYSWSNNIGAIYHAGVGLVALARLDENPAAREMLPRCIAAIKDPFYKASILPHDDGGYPEGPLYRNYALLWTLKFADAYERIVGDKQHGLFDPPFFRNSPRHIETLLGGDGVWVTFNDCQPQYYGGPWAAYLGARCDLPLCRWFADHCLKHYGERGGQEGGPFTFLWRDARQAEFPGLPTLSLLPSLNIGSVRSDRALRPGMMLAVRGRGADEHGHNQPDTGSFVLYARGENFLIDPGYYQPAPESHSLLVVDGAVPQRKKAAAVTGAERGNLRWLAIEATADYEQLQRRGPARLRRTFVMLADKAAIVLDDVVPGEGEPGKVAALWQTGFATRLQADQRSAVIAGKQHRLWMQTFGPKTAMSVNGPNDFGKSWIYKRLAEEGAVEWHTVRAEYAASAESPLVTVFVPFSAAAEAPAIACQHDAGKITVRLSRDLAVEFVNGPQGWQLEPGP